MALASPRLEDLMWGRADDLSRSTIWLIKSARRIPIMKMDWLTQHQKPVELRRFVAGESRFGSVRMYTVVYIRCRRLKAFRSGPTYRTYDRTDHTGRGDCPEVSKR